MSDSRLGKTIKNAKVSLFFLIAVMLATFLSRAIFIKTLGGNFVGLSATIVNIVGFLNLAEMGFASVVAFALYLPLRENNRQEIEEVTSVFAHIYRRIGYAVTVIGIIVGACLPYFFRSSGFSTYVVLGTYATFLITTLLGFFVNYREVLLVADQRNYVKVSIFNGVRLVKIALQIVVVFYTEHKIFGWLFLEAAALVFYSFALNKRIATIYPWMKVDRKAGAKLSSKYGIIYTKSKQAFVHKISAVALDQTGPVFVYMFSTLETVTKYTNYTIIITSLSLIVASLFDSTNAGVGNLVAEKNKEKTISVYWELQVSRFWLTSLVSYTLYTTVNTFISAWVGPSFFLPNLIIALLVANFFITVTRRTNDEFIGAYGLYHDVWAPAVETVITIVTVLVVGKLAGIVGVPTGALLGVILIVGIWKPIFLFKQAFGRSPTQYFIKIAYFAVIAIVVAFVSQLIGVIHLDIHNAFVLFIWLALQKFLVFAVLSFGAYWVLTEEMRKFSSRFLRFAKRG